MTPEAQRIAIAEACGWVWLTYEDFRNITYCTLMPAICAKYPGKEDTCVVRIAGAHNFRAGRKGAEHTYDTLPDYLTNLNAMHEAEKVLTHDQHIRFQQRLQCICSDAFYEHKTHWSRDAVSAAAAQRAEAFLHTLNLWKDSN